jgi:murein DD-endopeptidase MepM/ murein hydrolase activator NlpD
MRKHPKQVGLTRPHEGTDLRAPTGTPTYAVEDGMAIGLTSWSNSGGNMVTIRGNSGITTIYMHHTRTFVKMGDTIKAGQQIGESGNTGNFSAAPHLHFEVQPQGQGKVDARPYLCSPPEKADAGPDPLLNPGAQAGGSTTTNGLPNNNYPPMGSGSGAATSVAQASEMPEYSGMTVHEFLSSQSSRRFGNTQWYREINDPLDALRNSPDPIVRDGVKDFPTGDIKPMLWREILFMMNLKDFYAMEKYERGERIEQMLAADLADRVSEYTEKLLSSLRSQAATSAAR